MDLSQCEDEDEERRVLQAFAKTRPCPSYETVSRVVEDLALDSGLYDAFCHEQCAQLYAHCLHDDEKCMEIGRKIHEHGGMPALTASFYALTNAITAHTVARYGISEAMWDGVGDWRA
jgi:hypothetical protein